MCSTSFKSVVHNRCPTKPYRKCSISVGLYEWIKQRLTCYKFLEDRHLSIQYQPIIMCDVYSMSSINICWIDMNHEWGQFKGLHPVWVPCFVIVLCSTEPHGLPGSERANNNIETPNRVQSFSKSLLSVCDHDVKKLTHISNHI